MFKVIASDPAWRTFLKRAKKAWPNEHCEALWGIAMLDSFRILDFVKMNLNRAGTDHTTVDYDDVELSRQRTAAIQAGKEFIGTVHTHPSKCFDTSASTDDHHIAAKDGERIMGVVKLYKAKGKFVAETEWWIPQPKIEFQLLSE